MGANAANRLTMEDRKDQLIRDVCHQVTPGNHLLVIEAERGPLTVTIFRRERDATTHKAYHDQTTDAHITILVQTQPGGHCAATQALTNHLAAMETGDLRTVWKICHRPRMRARKLEERTLENRCRPKLRSLLRSTHSAWL